MAAEEDVQASGETGGGAMLERFRLRRWVFAVAAALVLVGGTLVGGDGDVAYAKKKKSKEKGNATVTIIGETTRQKSCEGKLTAEIRYTKPGNKKNTESVKIDNEGSWSLLVKKVKKGTFTATAEVVGHPTQSLLNWDEVSIEIPSSKEKDYEVDLGRLRVRSC